MTKIKKILPALILLLILAIGGGTIFFFTRQKVVGKILILTSTGGGGHLAASNAIEAQLKNSYQVEAVNVFKDLLRPLDPFSYLTLNRYSGEEIYNSFVPSKSFRVLSLFYYVGAWFMQLKHKEIQQLLHEYFIQTKPRLIISVIPLINNIILDAAQELNIPFVMVPTDLNVKMYLRKLKDPTYEHFKICLPFDDPEIMAPVKKANIPDNQVVITGPPLKQDFFEPKSRFFLKAKLGIPRNKPVIMVLMGAQGSDIENYTAELMNIEQPVHLILCFGKNEESKQIVSQFTFPSHITTSLVGFTTRISDYMAVSDLLLTKSGTLSVCEAMYMNLPMLLDATSTILPWEKFNHTFIKDHNFGQSISDYELIVPIVSSLLTNRGKLAGYKNSLKAFKKTKNKQEIKQLIRQML
jgi:UDP-N-acetylglucosamine:LPS N-acetylglucosamine transferase